MLTLGLSSVILSALAALTFYTGRSLSSMANYVDLDNYSRTALDTMSREIRQTRRLVSGTDTKLTFEDWDGKTLIYEYSATYKTLTRERDGVKDPQPLLTECDFLKFSMFQRNPISGTYDQYPTASASTCKLVQLRWICSRNLIYSKWNTESVQSAKIVIRKQ
jgi:hypothetical protein